ncbi:uncharacterized protein LOC128715396 [Anopheles marshallii]|uniref:uncharacterized protein LOC128715396 n=1 Tax=Anopheles marshallii TaxID=1521116 RepID=UPI00237AF911|nr:uncharacterized protein LOC128715396 [Anopheles marshallii]
MTKLSATRTGVATNAAEPVQSTISHVFDKRPLFHQNALRARPTMNTFYTGQQHFYQPNSFINDSSLLCDELKRVQQLELLVCMQHQQQQQCQEQQQQLLPTPAFMPSSLLTVPKATNRNRNSVITRQQLFSGSEISSARNANVTASAAVDQSISHQHPNSHWLSIQGRFPQASNHYTNWIDHMKRMHLEEQQCMLASIQAQLLYNWYRVWEATDQHGDRWWKNRTDVRTTTQTSASRPLHRALLQAFCQLISSAGDGGYVHPLIHFNLTHLGQRPVGPHGLQQAPRRGKYRTDQLSHGKAVSLPAPAGSALPKPINTTTDNRPSIGNNNPLTPFLFVYVPLLTPLPDPQQLPLAVNHTAIAGPPVLPRTTVPPSSRLPPSARSLDAIINDRLVQPFVYAPISNDN